MLGHMSLRDTIAFSYFSYLDRRGKLRSSEPEYDLLDQLLKKSDTVIDVGSNIGRYSLKCSKLVGWNGKVIAIEPNTRIMQIARLLSKKSLSKNIIFVEACVSDSSGLVMFEEDWSAPKSALFSTATRSKCVPPLSESSAPIDRYSEKLCITIDQLSVKPSLIKIDVEGHEDSVIKGALDTVNLFKPILIVEDNKGDYRVLSDLGYKIWQIKGSRNLIFSHSDDHRNAAIMKRATALDLLV